MKHKALILTAIAMLCLSACTGVQRGTETDNADIMVPDTVQKFTDADHALDFYFGIDWKLDDDLTFTKGDSYVATQITEETTDDLTKYAGEGFETVEGTDLDTVGRSRSIDGGIIIERYSVSKSTIIYFYAVLVGEDATTNFPVTVKDSDVIVDVTVCVGGCDEEVRSANSESKPMVLYNNNTDESETVVLDPSAMPQAQTPEYNLPGTKSEGDESKENTSESTLEVSTGSYNAPTLEIQP